MGFLERLGGGGARPRKEPEQEAPPPEAPTTSGGLDTSELLRDASPAVGALGAAPPGRLYDPYDGISSAIGGKKMVFQLPEAPEFVFQEEASVRRRGWGESLQYYTGLGYLGGGATGFAVGGYNYARMPPEPALDASMKLKANRLINQSGSLGRQFACGAAVLGLYFASFESYFHYLVDGRAPDSAVTTAAGFATAALYRAPRGPRAASVAGAVGAAVAAGLAALRQRYPSL